MGFFARPNLEDIQFRQEPGSILTLTGQTRIATTSGLTLTDGVGGYIPIIATGGTNYDVLTYCNGQITLKAGASGGTGVYTCASPTTCTVGGLASNTPIYGCALSYILEKILVPTVNPTVVGPSMTYTIYPSTNVYEVGCTTTITGCIQFSRGSNAPQYFGSSSYRSGLPNTHKYQKFGGSPLYFCYTGGSGTALNTSYAMSWTIQPGANTSYGSVCYDAGTVLYDSASGTSFISPNPLPTGVTTPQPQTVTGYYPWFWGKCNVPGPSGSGRPTATCAMVLSGTKTIASSTGDITINYNSTGDDYLWFAVPSSVTNKTCWCCNSSIYGAIGGGISPGCNLFPSPVETVSVISTTPPWTCNYDVYISNKQSAAGTLKMGYA